MSYEVMLDTNIVSQLIRAPSGGIVGARLRQLGDTKACLSIITAAELLYGARKLQSERLDRTIRTIFSVIHVLPFEQPAETTYATLRSQLQSRGTPIGPNDMLIAAHALTLGLTLVTANVREFSRVDDLMIENWLD